jgi:hypothetical protein
MIAAIHQPNFLPWLGYFYKMRKSDCFVLLDDVQYIRRGFTSRVKIKNPSLGEQWLTMPVLKKGRYHQPISQVQLVPDNKWKKKVLATLQSCYGKAPYFKPYFREITALLERDHQRLPDLNIHLIQWLARVLEIERTVVKASELTGVTGRASQRLVSICKAVGASQYLSGFGGQNYQEEEYFQQEGIELMISDFMHPRYPQLGSEFLPGLSAVDLLFNCGPDSARILAES